MAENPIFTLRAVGDNPLSAVLPAQSAYDAVCALLDLFEAPGSVYPVLEGDTESYPPWHYAWDVFLGPAPATWDGRSDPELLPLVGRYVWRPPIGES